MDTAAVIKNLDVIVSVDTSIVHLAGALEKPVWVLIPQVAEWRWLQDRTNTPWYPTMRLFRQKKYGNWHHTIEEITDELIHYVRTRGAD
jgi:ADP-heptose:LPS heptosyltransferase